MSVHSLRPPSYSTAEPRPVEDLGARSFADALHAALAQRPKRISPKWFYDERGSELFEAICELPEYYPTRTELGLLDAHAEQIAALIGPGAEVVEFGAGASHKVRRLLDALAKPRCYLPIDISGGHLEASIKPLRRDYPTLLVTPLAADFTQPLRLPPMAEAAQTRVGFFPGSSIGNFEPAEASALLARFAAMLRDGHGAERARPPGLLVGVDLVKSPALLHAAYNDAAGVTAAFNRNLLARAQRELDAGFDIEAFEHYAFYQPEQQRIEMHLLSRHAQTVQLDGRSYAFDAGESLHTERSYKYTVRQFQALACRAGFEPAQVWCDVDQLFSLHWLTLPHA
jgi:dimethylhistidine N-methyltransferase